MSQHQSLRAPAACTAPQDPGGPHPNPAALKQALFAVPTALSPLREAIRVRDARDSDMAAVQMIYGPYVTHSTGTFEEYPPSVEQMTERFHTVTSAGYPYLVAEIDGAIGGFTYGSQFRLRSAYRYTVEDSIYMAPEHAGRGIGRVLLGELIARCSAAGFRQMIAMVGDSANARSLQLHQRMGFTREAVLTNIGFKHGRWVDMVLMKRALGPGADTPPASAP